MLTLSYFNREDLIFANGTATVPIYHDLSEGVMVNRSLLEELEAYGIRTLILDAGNERYNVTLRAIYEHQRTQRGEMVYVSRYLLKGAERIDNNTGLDPALTSLRAKYGDQIIGFGKGQEK